MQLHRLLQAREWVCDRQGIASKEHQGGTVAHHTHPRPPNACSSQPAICKLGVAMAGTSPKKKVGVGCYGPRCCGQLAAVPSLPPAASQLALDGIMCAQVQCKWQHNHPWLPPSLPPLPPKPLAPALSSLPRSLPAAAAQCTYAGQEVCAAADCGGIG